MPCSFVAWQKWMDRMPLMRSPPDPLSVRAVPLASEPLMCHHVAVACMGYASGSSMQARFAGWLQLSYCHIARRRCYLEGSLSIFGCGHFNDADTPRPLSNAGACLHFVICHTSWRSWHVPTKCQARLCMCVTLAPLLLIAHRCCTLSCTTASTHKQTWGDSVGTWLSLHRL
jgi:hypothetical protein